MPALQQLLATRYQAWRADVPPTWQAPLQGIEPDFAGVPATSTAVAGDLFPRLTSDPLAGAPAGAGVLRCLDRVTFANVRVVVMGQDPYPRKRQATGRAFEQGGWISWSNTSYSGAIAASMRKVVQRLAQRRTGTSAYIASNGWSRLLGDLANGTLAIASPAQLFDAWENQGAIFLNKVLTYTRPWHVDTHHEVFWAPVVRQIVERLAARPNRKVVFAMWGAKPATLRAAIRNAAGSAWNTRVKVISGNHPATSAFLSGTNPFKRIDDALVAMGEAPLAW